MLRHWSFWTFPLHSTLSNTLSCVGACSHHSACPVQRYDGWSRICILGRSSSDVVRRGLKSCIFFVEYRKDRYLDIFCLLSTQQIWLLSLNCTDFVLTCMPTIHRFTAPADRLQFTISSRACQLVMHDDWFISDSMWVTCVLCKLWLTGNLEFYLLSLFVIQWHTNKHTSLCLCCRNVNWNSQQTRSYIEMRDKINFEIFINFHKLFRKIFTARKFHENLHLQS